MSGGDRSVRDISLLGAHDCGFRAYGENDASDLREALRQTGQDRCGRCRGDLRSRDPPDNALRAGQVARPAGSLASAQDAGLNTYNNFDNIQMTTYNPITGVSERFNAGKGHSVGAEIEATAQVTRAWDIHYTASYLYSRLDEFYGRPSAATVLANNTSYNTTPRAGNALPYSPRFQMSASSSYRLPLPRVAGQLRIGADVSFQPSLFFDGNENAQTRLPRFC